MLLVVWTIIDRRASAHRTAEIAAVNLSQTLADNFAHTIEKIDFGLRGVLDELADQRKRGSWDEQRILENIARQDQRNPNSVGFRIFGADGKRRFGVSTINSREADLSEREDFKYLRDHPEIGLFVSPPVFGITAQQWIIVVARRITEADGSFGGTVYGPIPIKNLIKAFSTLDLGRGGVVALYHTNLQLAARFPVVNGPEDPLGKVVINDQFRAAIGLGLPEAQFDYTAAVDGVRRLAHVRKIPGQPYYILVGFAEDDYLAEWRSETVHIVIAAAVMIALVLLAMRILLQRMGERRRSVEQLEQSEKFKQAIIDSVAPEIVVLDRQGVIAAVNEPWRDFLARNGEISGRYPPNIGIGANYLAACQASAAAGSNDAARALAGIGAVLDGRKPVFRMEHSTDWPRDKRWYSIVVLPLGKYAEDGVVITQTDVSRLKSAEADLRIAAAAFEAQEGMMITDANEVILQVNQAFCDNTGYEAADVIGHTPRLLKSGRHDKAFYAAMWASIDKTGKWQGEICGRRKDGQLY
ncbi:MAG TPA: PAS domain S-box protein, partial [Rhodospirillaceae bacterium]|nr:PAS domain S-box protein [Rhodospirillaceae bacterium]